MIFSEFSDIVSKIEKKPLPGKASHLKMASAQRAKILEEQSYHEQTAKKAAVLAAFYPDAQKQTHLLLIKRQGGAGVHANQIAFPGGKYEPTDNSLEATALREAYEEVGVAAADMRSLRALSRVYIPPSNFLVQPYMGLYHKQKPFVMESSEVQAILEIPLGVLLKKELLQYQKVQVSKFNSLEVPSFVFQDQVVWGATAMMLNEIRSLLGEVL